MPQAPLGEASRSAARSKSVREVARRVLTQSDLKRDIGKGSVIVRLVPNCPVSWLDLDQILIVVLRVHFLCNYNNLIKVF
jgi:hypothetical protein